MIEFTDEEVEYMTRFIMDSDPFNSIKSAKEEVKYNRAKMDSLTISLKESEDKLADMIKRDEFIVSLSSKIKSLKEAK